MGRNGFLIGLLLTVVSAWLAATAGLGSLTVTREVAWLRTAAVVGIFFIGGLTLQTAQLGRAAGHWRLHVFTQGTSLLLIPLLAFLLDAPLAALGLAPSLRIGLLVLACVPTTVTSCVVYTRLAGGNEAGALFNATVGQLLGILITPQLLFLLIGRDDALIEPVAVIGKLLLTVAAPVAAGQLIRTGNQTAVDDLGAALKAASNGLLLLILFMVFTASFTAHSSVPLTQLTMIAVLVVALRIGYLLLAWYLAAWPKLGFSPADRIAATVCASQKTIVLGLPLVTLLFPAEQDLMLITLPLILFHLTQLLLDLLFVRAVGSRQTT